MPNISLATLAGIPDVDQAAMTQINPNACGAFAIIAATGAFGVFPCVAALAYANIGPEAVDGHAATALDDRYLGLSTAAYAVTGVLNNDMNPIPAPVVPELWAAGNVYNSLAAMAQVAIDLGRPAPYINAQANGFALLNEYYPHERQRCEEVVGAARVSVTAPDYAAPAPLQTHVVCVHVLATGGLHWLAQGSDGLFYDPADGSLNNAWAPDVTGSPMGPDYAFAGLWMVLNES